MALATHAMQARLGQAGSRPRSVNAVYALSKPAATSTARPEGESPQPLGRRQVLLASLCAVAAAAGCLPAAALAEEAPAAAAEAAASTVTPIYFGSGCFWGRQYDFTRAEQELLKRDPNSLSALVGYAGGAERSPDGRVCYYYSDELTVYERLGHAEVVKVEVRGSGTAAEEQFRTFARTYFKQFRKTPFGMMRLDPQDAGPGYRNVIGLPGGIRSPFMEVLRQENVNGMTLKEGRGNSYRDRGHSEGDAFNTVWIVDSTALPFYQAEVYHQFHNGIGEAFPKEYTQGLKEAALRAGRINPTGCPEYNFSR